MLDYHEIAKKVGAFIAHCKNEKELAAARSALEDAIKEGVGVYQAQFPKPIGCVKGLKGGMPDQTDPLGLMRDFDRMVIDKEGVTFTHMGETHFVPHSIFVEFTVYLKGPKPE